MKIREIRLRDYKRFSHATIGGLPNTARLVMLVGPNGSGKSSLIDAVYSWYHFNYRNVHQWDPTYHPKQSGELGSNWNNQVEVEFFPPAPETEDARKAAVYVRTAYRNEPEFQLGQLSQVPGVLDDQRVARMIDNDQAVSRNYTRLVSEGFASVFETAPAQQTMEQFREQTIGEIRSSMETLFPGLVLNSLGNPLASGTFRFDKGDSKGFLYKNLSGGEKAAFDLLLDILVKKAGYNDTVFFIDEPEAHMSPGLQARLLDALMTILPGQSQLWLATHSIEMMRRARDLALEHPGSVVFIDFEGRNFDIQQTLEPVRPDRPFWKRAMRTALDDLAGYVAPEHVVLCEGGGAAGDFDAGCYNEIFREAYPQAFFLGGGNAHDVQRDPRGVQRMLSGLAPDLTITRVIDRDDRTPQEVEATRQGGVRVLSRRNIEGYLLDDEVLRLLCEQLERPDAGAQLIEAKRQALARSVAAGGATDDLKRIAGDVHNEAKRIFAGKRLGSDSRAFMTGFCAPLVNQVAAYQELRDDIFGP